MRDERIDKRVVADGEPMESLLVLRQGDRRRLHRSAQTEASSGGDEIDLLGRRYFIDETELACPVDRLAAARDPELPIDRDRLRLDRVAGDVEPVADLAEGEVGGQQRQQAELGPGQP